MAPTPKRPVDYSVYLVTDSTPGILPPGQTVEQVVQAALTSRQADASDSSIGIVQLRDKHANARQLLAMLAALHVYTAAAGVPLVLNDRVDVAAVAMARGHCEGVHLGQDDVDVATARRLLGPKAIIGATASTSAETVAACRAGANYLGLGTVYATSTKADSKHIVGPAGVRRMLSAAAAAGFGHIPAVCIGGVNAANARRVIFQASLPDFLIEPGTTTPPLGIAVVSAIMSAPDPATAADALAAAVRLGHTLGPTDFYRPPPPNAPAVPLAAFQPILAALQRCTPLAHNMTNLVVQNFSANVALALGASPIMANSGAEAADLALLPASTLLVNMGSITPESIENYITAISAYNTVGRPVVFDPVGAGATSVRRAAVRTILANGYLDVIKGNEGEIQAVFDAGETARTGHAAVQQRGVDGGNALDAAARVHLVRRVAAREHCVVVLTGPVDYVSDATGRRVVAVAHGHPLLSEVTGTGCTLGTVLAATVAAAGWLRDEDPSNNKNSTAECDTFAAVLAGLVVFERAAELAAVASTVTGPGSFVPTFLDCLAGCRKKAGMGDMAWIEDSYKLTAVE